MTAPRLPIAVAHLDESCLGNGREGDNPGGAGGLVEARTSKGIERREFFIHAPATTNNRMALGGAIALLQLLSAKGNRLRVLLISDSEYLVRGVREWLPGWVSRGWKRKAGAIENLDDAVRVLERRLTARRRIGTCAQPIRNLRADLQLVRHRRSHQGLSIRIQNMEVDSGDPFGHHPGHRVRAATAHADHFDPCAGPPLLIVLQLEAHRIKLCDLDLSHGARFL